MLEQLSMAPRVFSVENFMSADEMRAILEHNRDQVTPSDPALRIAPDEESTDTSRDVGVPVALPRPPMTTTDVPSDVAAAWVVAAGRWPMVVTPFPGVYASTVSVADDDVVPPAMMTLPPAAAVAA